MKATTPLLIVSLFANAGLGGAWLWHAEAEPTRAEVATKEGARGTAGTEPALPPARAGLVTATVSEAIPKDAAALAARLRGLGFPEPMIGMAVRAHLAAPRLARERTLRMAVAGGAVVARAGGTFHPRAEQRIAG